MSASPPPQLMLVLRELRARHVTGILSVSTAVADGEIRMRRGDIEDVVLGRADGKKALTRMFDAAIGNFAFREVEPLWTPRVDVSTETLIDEALVSRDELTAARRPFEERLEAFAVANEGGESRRSDLSPAARSMVSRLRTPASLYDVLDFVADDDAEIFRVVSELDDAGVLRWLHPQPERLSLKTPAWERARIAERLGKQARIVFAGAPHRLAVLEHALLHVEDMTRRPGRPPLVPMPHVVATTAFDGVEVEFVMCPLVPVYSPLWPMVLTDAALVVRIDEAAPGLLEQAADLVRTRVAEAAQLVGPLDEFRVAAVVALVRSSLDEAANN